VRTNSKPSLSLSLSSKYFDNFIIDIVDIIISVWNDFQDLELPTFISCIIRTTSSKKFNVFELFPKVNFGVLVLIILNHLEIKRMNQEIVIVLESSTFCA